MPKTVFITGCSSGVGLATAKHFYENGWNVVATMRNPKNDTELSKLDSTRLCIAQLDVGNAAEIPKAIGVAIEKFGEIDLLVNNAGNGQHGVFEMSSSKAIREQFEVNLLGPMELIRAVLPHYRSRNGGGIINISSGSGFFTLPMGSVYSASKHALESFTEGLSYELSPQNIYVKSVVPFAAISGTNFMAHVAELMEVNTELLPIYEPFLERVGKVYQDLQGKRATHASEVAEMVYKAATDGTDRLRYFIGCKEDYPFIQYFFESTSDEEYLSKIRTAFKGII
ncbi:hypothetical protein M422DRAFT_159578 [Sphaerobolus stellatus SS14]|nr:hypothetical protein M422DRAFT_159578 [Sphaerobolus stellatus SS14]